MTREEMLKETMAKPIDDKTGCATETDKRIAETLRFFGEKLHQMGATDVILLASIGEKLAELQMTREHFAMDSILALFEKLTPVAKTLVLLKLKNDIKKELSGRKG